MLLVRLLDSEREFALRLSFVIADDGEIGVLEGDPDLLDFDRPLVAPDGQMVTRREPERWALALARASEESSVKALVAETSAAASVRPVVSQPRSWPWLLTRGACLLALVCAATGVGAWQSGALKQAVSSVAGKLSLARPALAADAPSPLPSFTSRVVYAGSRSRSRAGVRAASNAAAELAGSGDFSVVSWNPAVALWDRVRTPAGAGPGWKPPIWWQSALALRSLVRFLEQTHNTAPGYQQLITTLYDRNVRVPGSNRPLNFGNQFMDDTAWWGLAWLEAARYELNYQHDFATASRYLHVAEWDARYIYSRPRSCGAGIAWKLGSPPGTITEAQFVSLSAQLAQVRSSSGPFQDEAAARAWRSQARQTLSWLESSGLVNMTTGTVRDRYDRRCRVTGAAITYTQGEMAEALVQMGRAFSDPAYFNQASVFINHVLTPSVGMVHGGVLQEPCEAGSGLCGRGIPSYNSQVYKGLFVDAVSDWSTATESTTYDGFLLAQARAVMANSASDGLRHTGCQTAHACQLGFYWSQRVSPSQAPVRAATGSQEAGLSALTDALAVPRTSG